MKSNHNQYPAPQLYDGDTGVETLASLLARKEIIDAQIIEDARSLSELKSSKGFKILSNFLNEAVEKFSADLLSARGEDVVRCQEIIKSYKSIFSWIDTNIDQSKLLEEQISKS